VKSLLPWAAALLALFAARAPAADAIGEDVRLSLPASFIGTLPCPDCAGARAHLDLWPDGTYHLGRAFTDKPGHDDDLGRWRRDPGRPVLLLYGGREMPMQLQIVGPRTLRALDLDGQPAGAGAQYDLSSDGRLQPTDLSRGLHGMFRYLADAATFEECMTGRSYPVAMEGDYLALERAYTALDKAEPGAPVMASFDGELTRRPAMEGKGTVPTVVVRRFVGLWPSQTCERAMSHASLSNQYWKIVSLKGETVAPVEGAGEMHLVLRGEGSSYTASAGCERLNGGYQVDGPRITFDPPADLRPSDDPPSGTATCPAALQERQRILLEVLSAASRWSIEGQGLELFSASGQPLAVLEAVYLR
jgi:copper homeostasis protein (lipoprotein)